MLSQANTRIDDSIVFRPVCSKTVVARPGSEKAVQSLCKDVVDFSRREMADRGNGILEFGCTHDLEDNHVFHFFERYTSNGKLGEHNVKKPVRSFMEKVPPFNCRPQWVAWWPEHVSELCIAHSSSLSGMIRHIPLRNGICYACNPVALRVLWGMYRHSALYQTMLAELKHAFA